MSNMIGEFKLRTDRTEINTSFGEPIISLQNELLSICNDIKGEKDYNLDCEFLYKHNILTLHITTNLPIFYNNKKGACITDVETSDGIMKIRKFINANLKLDDQIAIERMLLSDREEDDNKSVLELLLPVVKTFIMELRLNKDRTYEIKYRYLISSLALWREKTIPLCAHFRLFLANGDN